MSRTIEVEVGGSSMDAYVEMPEGDGPHPGVVLCFHRGGMDAFTHDRVEKLANAGYAAIAPDMYHRHKGQEAGEAVKHRHDDEVIADIGAALDWLRAQPNVDGNRIAIMGHCMGGRTAFVGACAYPDAFKGVVTYYGGGMFAGWGDGPSAFDRLSSLKCPVVGFYGNNDTNPAPADVDKIQAALKEYGIPYEVHRYDGAGHAFQGWPQPAKYHEKAATESWARTIEWLGETV
jgi:carboxymethylenebutenolidase